MKKIKNFILCLMFAIIALFSGKMLNTNAAVAANTTTFQNFETEMNLILTQFCANYKTRVAGSENEKLAATYIQNYLQNIDKLTARNDLSAQNGIQTFQFLNAYTDLYSKSQNVIFDYKSENRTGKKVIIACSYDAPLKYDEEKEEYVSFANDALNSSAGSVALTLLLAKNLPELNPTFDIEFVFFGAGENSCAGSEFYLNGLSKEDAQNILCVINIDKVAVGKNIYFYMDEISTEFSKYVAKTCASFMGEVDTNHLNKTEMLDNKLNLGYSHIALNSDNVNFMSRGIATINLFAGEYEDGVILGRNEYNNKAVITYTENDTLSYVSENYGEDVVVNNLYKVSLAVETLLTSEDFVAITSKSYGNTSWFYKIFANEKLASYLTIVAFFVVLIISMYVYYKLAVKSYGANLEVEFLSSVVKISDELDKDGKDENVSSVVGQVIANDIKKDKMLKSRKKDKK